MIIRRKGQTTLEFSILLMIVIAAFLVMQAYMKRGLQGRWKATLDDLGEQYDPRLTNSNIVYRITGNASTELQTVKDVGGYWTIRNDNSTMRTTTSGSSTVGASN